MECLSSFEMNNGLFDVISRLMPADCFLKAQGADLLSLTNEYRDFPLSSIDLFCGAGGITEGFRQAGYQCLYGNDVMPEAISTFKHNHPHAVADPRGVESVQPREIREMLGLSVGKLDVLAGGPPCQGFSINAPGRFLSDPRNIMFRHYERFLEEFLPRAFVFENVPGLLSIDDGRVFEEIIRIFSELGYSVSAKILFAAHYGVPQERWRLIILGSREGNIEHPEPSHFAVRRANFRGGSSMIFRLNEDDRLRLNPHETVGDAIGDLPRLKIGEGGEVVSYTREPHSLYSMSLRNSAGETYNHYAGNLSLQNRERMKHVAPGGSWRDIPVEMLPTGMQRARKSDHTKRYGRLSNNSLAGTVMTKCDPHWGTVFLPDQERTLTVREAARFQSFPDHYRFMGPRVSQYVQVGNAVPVFLARSVAWRIRQHLSSSLKQTVLEERSEVAYG